MCTCTSTCVVHTLSTHRPTHNPAERVPRSVVKPVEEVVEPMFRHVVGRPVVEPAITETLFISTHTHTVHDDQLTAMLPHSAC